MTAIPVTSRMIKAIYFSQADGRLMLCFHDGQGRVFEGVTAEAVSDLVGAASPGQHYVDRFRHQFRRAA